MAWLDQWSFWLYVIQQRIAQQHHSPDPSEKQCLQQGKLRAGDDGR
jgi:hypothetical protein